MHLAATLDRFQTLHAKKPVNPPQKANHRREKVTTTIKRKKSEKVGKLDFTFLPRKQKWDPLLDKTKKFYASRFYQLKIGHGAIGTFLNRIGATETAECWWCGNAQQSVIHLYTKCRKWRAKRRVLRKSPGQFGIQWQRRPEKRWLAQLLADRYAAGPFLKFLKDTEVGGRDGGAEREIEWGQRRDQFKIRKAEVLKGRKRSNRARLARQSKKEK